MPISRSVCLIAVSFQLIFVTGVANAQPSPSQLGGELFSDVQYLGNNVLWDAEDVVTSPLYVASPNSPLRSPRFYLVLAGAGALWGGSYALDQTMRSHLHHMSGGDATLLQNISYGSVSAGAALLYGYGLWVDDPRARHYAITAGEGAGVATLVDIGIKVAFGRLRPRQDSHNHDAWFSGGQSFVSGDVTPMFALAAGVSQYYNNAWYASVPAYSLALLDGFGRMGHDAHWFSDVVGAALLGAGTTELFIWLHHRHEEEPGRWKLIGMNVPQTPVANAQAMASTGLGLSYNW